MAGMTDPDRIWTEAAGRLRSEIGEGPFSSYIAPSAVRADGAGPISDDSRETRPPSSSTLTANGSGPRFAIPANDPSVSIDRSVQLPIMMPPT